MSINVFTFTGRIGRDAEVRSTGSGKSVTGFPVAMDVGYGDNKHAVWIDCSMWGERGEKIAEFLIKGGVVTVSGEADLQTYQSQGVDKTKLTCRVNDVQLPPRAASDVPQQRQEQRRAPLQNKAPADTGFADDEIPF
jgi:single-strand DNA-binding protein